MKDVVKLWWLSLGLFAVVIGVVAALLQRIVAAAQSIDRHAADIWTAGKQIAGNTVTIWTLVSTNEHLAGARDSARAIERTVTAMDEKLSALAGASRQEGQR